jgi:hypothetical protein
MQTYGKALWKSVLLLPAPPAKLPDTSLGNLL